MTLRLAGSSSGFVEIDSPAVGGNNTLVLPTGNGSANQALVTDGSGALSWSDRGRMTLATAQNSTSGTAIDFTGIPSWVKRVTVMFIGVSTNGGSVVEVRLGAGSIVATGYSGSGIYTTPSSNGGSASTTGIQIPGVAATNFRHGTCLLVNASGNTWVASACGAYSDAAGTWHSGSSITLSGTLDRIRITTVSGTDAFDAGSINILYEG